MNDQSKSGGGRGGGEPFSVWVIYDHPLDYPNNYVARRHVVEFGAGTRPTGDCIIGPHIEMLRAVFAQSGMIRLNRVPEDDPKIVESWL